MRSDDNINLSEYYTNPDNWLEIPEFNIQPMDVNFKGFARPIFGLKKTDWLLDIYATNIFAAVSTVRALARQRFTTLAALLEQLDSIAKTDPIPSEWSPEQRFAWRYDVFMEKIHRAVTFLQRKPQAAAQELAVAMCAALELSGDMPLGGSDIVRYTSASAAGKKGAEVMLARSEKQKCKEKARVFWLEEHDLYDKRADFARDMMLKFPCLESQAVIAQWTRDWDKEREQSLCLKMEEATPSRRVKGFHFGDYRFRCAPKRLADGSQAPHCY